MSGAPAGKAMPSSGATSFGDPAAVDAAHRAIRNDGSIQFDLPWHVAEKRSPPPKWLMDLFEAIGNFVNWVGGGWRLLMWLAIIAVVLTLLYKLYRPLRDWIDTRRGLAPSAEVPRWAPEIATARALLDEADRLAAQGRYGEAVRLILHRSIQDIEKWRGDPLRPSLTSRDIARFDALPDAARGIFERIVADVERSLFGGGSLHAADWNRARADYAGFALGRIPA